MKIERFETQLKQAENTSFSFVEDLGDAYQKVRSVIKRSDRGALDYDSVKAQWEDFRSNVTSFQDEPERVKTPDKKELFDLADKISLEELEKDVLQSESEPEPEPEPSPGIPEGEEPEDSQREMNPLVIYAIVGILAYVTAR